MFDGEFRSSPGLIFDFSRAVETLDRAGKPVWSDEPRYGRPRRIVPAPVIELVRGTAHNVTLLGSGVDHDGVTPLLIVREDPPSLLDVFTVAGDELLEGELSGEGRNRTDLRQGPGPMPDLMQGAIPDKAYTPVAGAVCHGLIVTLCVVYRNAGGEWNPGAVAFVVSTDRGQTWSVYYEDDEVQVGLDRAREWSMQNWWPMERGPAPLEAWFAAADYRYKPDCTGGRVLLFRATREAVAAPWNLEPVVVPIEVSDGVGEHAHSAGVVPFGENGGLRVLAAIGDGLSYNRIISAVRDDSNYTEPGWFVSDDYQGSVQTSGYQFVGAAPGSKAGEMIVGSDENCDQIHLLRPDDDPDSRAVPELLYGQGFEIGRGSRNFIIRTPTPNLGGPYVAKYSSGGSAYGVATGRVLYSPNGVEWTEAFAPGVSFHGACIHGEHIYIDSLTGGPGLMRIPMPDTLRLRPLLVGSGGVNRQLADARVSQEGSGTMITRVSRTELDPPPPCFGPVFEVQTTDSKELLLGVWRLAEVETPGLFHARMWCQILDAESVSLRLHGTVSQGPQTQQRAIWPRAMQSAWYPVTFRDLFDPSGVGEPYEFHLKVRKPLIEEVFRFYIAFDALTEGTGFPGYALPSEQAAPNELASVSGFQATSAWTITLAGELPDDVWDASTEWVTQWPLFTIWAGEEDYIEVIAFTPGRKLLANITAQGQDVDTLQLSQAFWLRGSQLRVSISESGNGLEMTAVVGSGQLASDTSEESLSAPPVKILFSNADQSDVGAFAWFGGQIDEAHFIGSAGREADLETLDYLVPAARPNLDHSCDGVVDPLDLVELLSHWGPCSPPQCPWDLDRDGDVGPRDLAIQLNNWK